MRGARERQRLLILSTAEAVRAATHLDGGAYRDWVATICGRDALQPEENLDGWLRQASHGVEAISMAEALKRMH